MGLLDRRRRGGFTLIEVMIVILIIVALMGIAWPNWMKARQSARTQTCLTNLKHISAAKEHFAMEQRKAPGDAVAMTDLVPDFVREEPSCPAGGDYTPEPVGDDPTCTYAGHVMP